MMTSEQYRRMNGRPSRPLNDGDGARMAETAMREIESRDASKPAARRITASSGTRPQQLNASASKPMQPRLSGVPNPKPPESQIAAKHKEAMKSIAELGGMIAKAKADRSDVDFAAILDVVGIKPAEAQSYVDFAHKANETKPTARRAKKGQRAQSGDAVFAKRETETLYGRI